MFTVLGWWHFAFLAWRCLTLNEVPPTLPLPTPQLGSEHVAFVRRKNHISGWITWALSDKKGDWWENTSSVCFGLWKWTKGGVGGEDFGSDGWLNKKPGFWAEVLLLQMKRLPRREAPFRAFRRLRGAAKREDRSDVTALRKKKKKLQLRQTERHLFHKSCSRLRGVGLTAAFQSAPVPHLWLARPLKWGYPIIAQLSLIPLLLSQHHTVKRCLELEAKKKIKILKILLARKNNCALHLNKSGS